MGAVQINPFRRLLNATRNSLRGLGIAWRSEAALRYEVWALFLVIPAAWWLGASAVERALLVASALLVVVLEVVNTAVETVVDRIGSEHHELSGLAKDLGSASVFCAIVLALVVWGIVIFN
jgi:diacylglycerol kinase (ATP)